MPWTIADVDRFKKGLTPAQKRQWVKIANDALSRCRSRGGKNCDASAIRQANGSVGRNSNNMETNEKVMLYFRQSAAEYEIREETLNGRKHIVVPVVMMVEGVHSGSAGAIFHMGSELARYTEAWNGIPVVIYHPENEEGMNVSANDPEVLEAYEVGRIFHTYYQNGLRAEVWIDVEKIQKVSPQAYADILARKPLDVSVGIYSDSEDTEGEWNGETYVSVAVNYRPDHLALLPGETGACSWNDGCGIRANRKGGSMEDSKQIFKKLNQDGFAIIPVVNQQGYRELFESLRSQLDAMDTNNRVHYLQEVYDDDTFVYSVRGMEGGETLYKRGYTVGDNGVVSFGEDPPVEVRRKVEYVTMGKMVRTKFNNNKSKTVMSDEKDTLCCEGKVDALIANEKTPFTAADKEKLMSLGEELIDKLVPTEPTVSKTKVETPVVNEQEVIDTFKSTLKTVEDYTALMPDEVKRQFDSGMRLYKENRESLIKGITDNTGDNFSKEMLEAMDDTALESIYKSVTPADYSGQGGTPPVVNNGEEVELLLPIGVQVNNEKKED